MAEAPEIRSRILGEGQPLVLLHAFPLDHGMWEGIPWGGFRLIMADFPGFGLSPKGPDGMTLEQAADGLRKHLDASGITEPVLLAGCSMGGYWAMEFARQFPERVARLALISTKSGLDSPERRDKRLEIADRVLREGMGWYVQPLIESLLGPTFRQAAPGRVQELSRAIQGADPRAVAAAQRAMASRRDQTGFLRTCPARSRWFVGTEDSLTTVQEVKVMAQESNRSGYEAYRCGHLIPIEMPRPLATSLIPFLTRTELK